MKTLINYRHTALVAFWAAFMVIAQPIPEATSLGLLVAFFVPLMASLEWMLQDLSKPVNR